MGQGVETQDIFEVETERCVLWPFHNRLYDLLSEMECGDLIESIRTHGQMVPVIGRRRHTEERADIEVVSGARRLWVARYLKLRIRIEIRALTDEEAFVVSEDSNRYSDISPFERAREYQRALEAVFDGNQARMAARINLSP
ncbi:parB-like partition protein, partial [mine drainage metagenome]